MQVDSANLTAAPWVFLKEISSDGNVNTLDVLYQSWPIWISLNPDYIKMLFEPIIAYLEVPVSQGQGWPEKFTVHDLGARKFLNSKQPDFLFG
jgi:hypothetical protein